MPRVVVGVNGSNSDRIVLCAALREAARRDAALCVVHALGVMPLDLAVGQRAANRAWAAQQDALAAVLQGHLSHALDETSAELGVCVPIEYQISRGDPATRLLDAARHADVLVVGTRCPDRGSPLLLGTVSQDVAVHSPCPVLLIPTAP